MNIGQTLSRFELSIRASGTSEGASKGWESREHGNQEAYDPDDEKNEDLPESRIFYNVGDTVKNGKGRVGTVSQLNYRHEGNVLVKSKNVEWEERADNLLRYDRVH